MTAPRKRAVARSRAPEPLPDVAIVVIHMDRQSGTLSIDTEWANPHETFSMLSWSYEIAKARLEDRLFDRHESE